MIDPMSPKVVTPAVLFALLSPGVLLQIPDRVPLLNKGALMTGSMSTQSVLFHSLVFLIVYRMVAKMRGIVLKPADLVVSTVLFVLLSPGLLLSVTPRGVKFQSGRTSLVAVLIHALVFALVFAFLRSRFPQVY